MDSALVGVVIGAVLGGGAQIVADLIRSRSERRRWIDDHKRETYLQHLTHLEELFYETRNSELEADAYTAWIDSLQPSRDLNNRLRFYGSDVIAFNAWHLEMEMLVHETQEELMDHYEEIRHRLDELASMMKDEIGVPR